MFNETYDIDSDFEEVGDDLGVPYPIQMSSSSGRRDRYDPSEIAALPDDDSTPSREAMLREMLVGNTKVVLQKLLDDLTEENASRVLSQLVAQGSMTRKMLRVYGAYDMPELRRKRGVFGGGLLGGTSPFGGLGVSDAETFGAVAMREGLSGFQDWMRSKKIDELTQAYGRAKAAKLNDQAEKIKAEIDGLLDGAKPASVQPTRPPPPASEPDTKEV
jgi:hypothetical protein